MDSCLVNVNDLQVRQTHDLLYKLQQTWTRYPTDGEQRDQFPQDIIGGHKWTFINSYLPRIRIHSRMLGYILKNWVSPYRRTNKQRCSRVIDAHRYPRLAHVD